MIDDELRDYIDREIAHQTQTQIVASTRELVNNAYRYGLIWLRRPATIVDGSNPVAIVILLDGDTTPVSAVSLSGGYIVGSRVMVDIVPPSGIYVIGDTPASTSRGLQFLEYAHYTATVAWDYTIYSGVQMFDTEVQGGGGGGGGADDTAAGECATAGGGGGGGYAKERYTYSQVSIAGTVTIGAGGTAGANTGADGGAGGTTDFLGLMSATGGGGGQGDSGGSGFGNIQGGDGGTGSGGDVNLRGSDGGMAIRNAGGVVSQIAFGGWGVLYASSRRPSGADGGGDGANAASYGNGGSGAFNPASAATPRIGGTGSAGIVRIGLYV